MGRRNKKEAKHQESQQAREFLKHQEKAPSYAELSKEEKRIEIAHAATLILSSPEMQHTKILALIELCNDPSEYIQALAITSLCSIFIDILPGYEIKTEEEQIEHTKEVKAVQIYENTLLNYYDKYLTVLTMKSQTQKGALKCVARLLSELMHFNYRDRLLKIALGSATKQPEIVIPALKHILQSKELEFRFKAIKEVHQLIKSTSYKLIPDELIEVIGEMDLNQLELEEEGKPKKKKKTEEDFEKDLEETKDEVMKQKLVQSNQKTLKEVLAIYFRIIKQWPKSYIFAKALKGVAKYCSVLNIDLVLDLVKHLLKLLESGKLKGENQLQCIQSSIKILSLIGETANIEQSTLIKVLYTSMLSIPTTKEAQKTYIKALSWLLLDRKQYSYELVAAYLKRILQTAFHCELPLMKAMISLAKYIINTFPKAANLLEQDEEGNTEIYVTETDDPLLSNASSSNLLYEIKALKTINDKEVQSLVKSLSNPREPIKKKPTQYLA